MQNVGKEQEETEGEMDIRYVYHELFIKIRG